MKSNLNSLYLRNQLIIRIMTLHPQYITDNNGKAVSVILPMKEFKNILEELEELEDVKLYDKAKKNDDGVRISMDEAFRKIEAKRKQKK
jgi:hypothetical protein